ncbi:abl interactor 2 isoform X2 [Achroia grisella]|nr:abl interactor 2 isoform X2 [Achroia grisella]XP_059051844.1 abl interactor 2 isoform X2 [Achroia grisella]XP_059051845.1 abl interactor 2 isoform X2 [Achroia grisella]
MKGPARPAPAVPAITDNRYSSVTNWNDDPFGADVFEPSPQYTQKKKPPPRPPPPKINSNRPDISTRPSHFIRKPTVYTSLMSRKNNRTVNNPSPNFTQQDVLTDASEIEINRMFPKCENKNAQTGALIDLSSPPSSPTFTTRSSSDGLSVDSFGSDATTSTSHQNMNNGGNASQAESGFEDDFDLFLHSRKTIGRDDTFDDFNTVDPFSPSPALNKPPIMKKPVLNKDPYNVSSIDQSKPVPLKRTIKGPTIIRAKPARPKLPDNSALLKNTFGSSFPVAPMTINTTIPIQKINNGFGDDINTKPIIGWNVERSESDRESSPPMPCVPPPPPPAIVDEDLPVEWREDLSDFTVDGSPAAMDEVPHAVALFDYFTDHPEDLCFSANTRIELIRRVDKQWLYGRLRSGIEGIFPANYVEIEVPLPNGTPPTTPRIGLATALYDFEPAQPGDLQFRTGDTICVSHKLNDEWYYGEFNGKKGQFPFNYVQMC